MLQLHPHPLNPQPLSPGDENLADFLFPFASPLRDLDDDAPPRVRHGLFFVHEKITDSVQQVHLALDRFNAVSPVGPVIFRQNSRLVRVVKAEDGCYAVHSLDRNRLRLVLSEAGTWKRFMKEDICEPDNALLDAAIAAPPERYPLIPVLTGLYPGVLLRPDRTIACSEGFDAATGFYLTRSFSVPPVPECPTSEDISFVRAMFSDLFCEFLFAGPADEANAVAAVVTAVLRPTLAGPVPIWAIDKNTPRAGGSLLSLVVGALAFGEVPVVHSASRRKDEIEKIIRMTVREGSRYVIMDNVEAGTNWCPEVLLSATSGSGRVLSRNMGTFESFSGKVPTFFVVNGVHLAIRADVTGRMFLVRLTAPKAWQEMMFSRTKTELLELAEAMHPQVVWGVAVMLGFWEQAGLPPFRLASGNMSEYPEWLRQVAGAVYAAGWSAVLANQGEMQTGENEADSEGADLMAVLYAVFGVREFSAKELLKVMITEGAARKSGQGFEGLLNYADEAMIRSAVAGTLSSVKVGMWLKGYVGTRFAGAAWYLDREIARSGNTRRYFLQSVEQQTTLA